MHCPPHIAALHHTPLPEAQQLPVANVAKQSWSAIGTTWRSSGSSGAPGTKWASAQHCPPATLCMFVARHHSSLASTSRSGDEELWALNIFKSYWLGLGHVPSSSRFGPGGHSCCQAAAFPPGGLVPWTLLTRAEVIFSGHKQPIVTFRSLQGFEA